MSSDDDAALMEKLASGDATALGPLFERHGEAVHRLLCRTVPRGLLAEVDDMTQDVFITAYENAGRYREQGRLRSWLYGIAVRKARGRGRRVALRFGILERLFGESGSETAASAEGSIAARHDVERALAALGPEQREVLVLHVLENLEAKEIAAILGISPNTVWTRLHRARAAMRRALEPESDS